jgi:hypothetical protein
MERTDSMRAACTGNGLMASTRSGSEGAGGATLTVVRAKIGLIRQALDVPWLRVTPPPPRNPRVSPERPTTSGAPGSRYVNRTDPAALLVVTTPILRVGPLTPLSPAGHY